MSKQIDALKMALEAFEAETDSKWECNSYHPKIYEAITAIKKALAVDKESLTTEARHMPSNDALYKAWNLIGADLAGLKFEDFVRHLLAQQNNEQDTCKGCNGNGVVGNILDVVPCPFCKGSGIESQQSNEQVEPVAWYRNEDIFGNQEMEPIFYATKAWDNCLPLYAHPPVPTAQPDRK